MCQSRLIIPAREISYKNAVSTISFYAKDALYLFANKEEKWPTGTQADRAIEILGARQSEYESTNAEYAEYAADEINTLRCAILYHMGD